MRAYPHLPAAMQAKSPYAKYDWEPTNQPKRRFLAEYTSKYIHSVYAVSTNVYK